MVAEVNSPTETLWPAKLNIAPIWPLIVFADLFLKGLRFDAMEAIPFTMPQS